MNSCSNLKVAFLVFPYESRSVFAISRKLVLVLSNVADFVYYICGNFPDDIDLPPNVIVIDIKTYLHYVRYRTPYWYSALCWILKFIYVQLRMSLEIFRNRKNIHVVFCYLGNYFQLPTFTARLLRKKVIIGASAVDSQIASIAYNNTLIVQSLRLLMNISYFLSHVIVVNSWRLAEQEVLKNWTGKLMFGASYFGDKDLFRNIIPLRERKNIIGFVGRFSAEKGIIEFINAIPSILNQSNNIDIFIVGSGMLEKEVNQLLEELRIESKVQLFHWINYLELPSLYNQMKLVVIPSTSEGLPNVLLEAVSCGTPVLATSAGGITDLIEDGVTGFILANNSPSEIADKVNYLLDNPYLLDKVTQKCKDLLEENYSFKASVLRYSEILSGLAMRK